MKKLMFAAVAVACGTAMAIESDIVGYGQAGLRSGNQAKGVGNMFLNVDSSALTLGDVTVTGYAPGEGGETGVYCQFLDGYGRTVGDMSYCWYDFGTKGEGTEMEDWAYGWYNSDGDTCYNDVELPAGEGVWMYSPSTDYSLQGSGLVPKAPIAVTLRSGNQAKLVINPMPTTLTFADMWISGYAPGEGGETGVYCQFLDGYGRTVGDMSYCWYDFGTKGEGTEMEDWAYGWYNSDGDTSYNDVEIPAGTGVWMYSPSSSFSVNFKSPLN